MFLFLICWVFIGLYLNYWAWGWAASNKVDLVVSKPLPRFGWVKSCDEMMFWFLCEFWVMGGSSFRSPCPLKTLWGPFENLLYDATLGIPKLRGLIRGWTNGLDAFLLFMWLVLTGLIIGTFFSKLESENNSPLNTCTSSYCVDKLLSRFGPYNN